MWKLPKLFFGWTNFKTVLIEIWNTLSSGKSKLSSKRLITFVANNSVVTLTWIFVIYMLLYKELSATDFVISITPILVMGGYSLTKSESAKKEELNEGKD